MKQLRVLILILTILPSVLYAQTETFEPNGSPFMKIFTNYHTTFSDGSSASAFELTRVYLGYQYNFSEKLSGKANFDIGNPGAGSHEMAAYVKNAYLSYNENNLSVNFGLIATTQFKVQEKAWGYRYLEKSFQDAYKFNSSADLGVSAAYKLTDFLSADVIIANGEGYKKIEGDSALRTGFGITLQPVSNLTARVYYDFSTKEHTQTSLATFIGYAGEKFDLSAEYMKQFNPGFVDMREWEGTSFYGTVYTSKKTKLFARYDKLFSNTPEGEAADWNLGKDGELFILGFEYSPARGVKITPNFQGWNPADPAQAFSSTAILNLEITF